VDVGNLSSLEREIADFVDHNLNQALDKLSFTNLFDELMGIFKRYQLALKPSLYLMCKSLAMLESIGKELDPNLKLVELIKPYILKLKRQSFNQLPRLKRFLYNIDDQLDDLSKMPIAVKNILTQVENKEFSLQLEHHHLDDIEETFYVATEHLSRALLLTALLIGSSLIIVAKIPPYWNNIPIIGAVGFLGSAFISFYVLYMDHRQRKKFLRQRALKKMEARYLSRD
jgi:ubiquinone biosynthesis protein